MQGVAAGIRDRSLELVERHDVCYEYYSPLDASGLGAHDYMWTGALYIVMGHETHAEMGNGTMRHKTHPFHLC